MGVEPAIDISAEQRETILALLERHLPGTAAWVYGSRTKWTSRPQSDLDLVVFSTPEQRAQVGALRDAFEESDLPFRVDLFVWDDVPKAFHEKIETEHVALVSSDVRRINLGWNETTLGDVIELKRGYDLPRQQRISGAVPVVSSSGVIDYHQQSKVSGPGVVIGRYGTLGQVFFIRDDYWPLNTALYVRDFKGNDPRFISYFLESLDVSTYSDKAAVPGINRNHLHQEVVCIPSSTTEQRGIAHVLSTLDDKIELNRRMNETLEAMARALFKSWFVDFDPVRAKMEGRDPGLPKPLAALFPDRFVASEIGEIPEGWRVRPLGDLVTISRGLSYKGAGLTTPGCGMPLHNLNSIEEGGGYKPDGLKYYSGEYKQRHVVRPGNLIVTNTEQGFDHLLIGYSAIVPEWSGPEALFSHHIFLIKMMPGSPLSELWLHYAISASWVGEAIRRFSNGTTVNMMPADTFGLADTIVPPRNVVDAFCKIVGPMLKQQEHDVVCSRNLAALRDRLLPRLISGDIRLREAEKVVEAIA